MKKLLYLMAIASFVACTNDEEMNLLTDNLPEESVSVEKRSFQEALEVAQNAPEIFGGTTTRGELKQVTLANTQYIISDASTRNDAPDTLMYVFNYEDNQGFAVVSANKSTEALIAVTEQGTYNEETETDNPGLALYMDMAKNYVARGGATGNTIIGGGGLPLTEEKTETTTTITSDYGPFLEVRWGQGEPYNTYCYSSSNQLSPTGCVATALAQIFSYTEYPTNMPIYYDYNNYHVLYINWDTLKGHISSKEDCNCTSTTHTQLAEIFRQIGEKVGMTYTPTDSWATTNPVLIYLDELGYSHSGFIDYNENSVINSLSNNNIVYIAGQKNSTDAGHVWVLDGYKSLTQTTKTYRRPAGQLDWTLISSYTYSYAYNHFNWGWDGDGNGYFTEGVFKSNSPYDLDDGVSSSSNSNNYSYEVGIIANIRR